MYFTGSIRVSHHLYRPRKSDEESREPVANATTAECRIQLVQLFHEEVHGLDYTEHQSTKRWILGGYKMEEAKMQLLTETSRNGAGRRS